MKYLYLLFILPSIFGITFFVEASNCCKCTLPNKFDACITDPPDVNCAEIFDVNHIKLPDSMAGTTCAHVNDAQCKLISEPSGICQEKKTYIDLKANIDSIVAKVVATASSTSDAPSQSTGLKKGDFTFTLQPPKLNIDIPLLKFAEGGNQTSGEVEVPWFAQYIAAIFNYLLGISLITAAIMIVYGGFLYTLSATVSSITKGKEIIQDAIIGTIILLSIVLILKIIPGIALKPIRIRYIDQLTFETVSKESMNSAYKNNPSERGSLKVDAGGNIDYNTTDCKFELDPKGLPTSESVKQCSITMAKKAGVNPCFSVVALKWESGGKSDAIGHDENVYSIGSNTPIPQAFLNFVRSGTKYSGKTFDKIPNLPDNVTEENKPLTKKLISENFQRIGINDDKFDPSKEDLGLDWRPGITHGWGVKQITFGKNQWCKGTTPSVNWYGKCYTALELLTPAASLEAGLTTMKDAAKRAGVNIQNPEGRDGIYKIWAAYAGSGTKKNSNAELRTNDVLECIKSGKYN